MPEPTKRQMKLRTTPLSVAFALHEREQVNEAAELAGETVSAFIRAAAVKQAERALARAKRAAEMAA